MTGTQSVFERERFRGVTKRRDSGKQKAKA